jgi:hypothetical protein
MTSFLKVNSKFFSKTLHVNVSFELDAGQTKPTRLIIHHTDGVDFGSGGLSWKG